MKNKNKILLSIFMVFSILILIGYYYFFVHKVLVLEEVSPNSEYTIKCYEGPEYNQVLITFESSFESKSREFRIGNDRRPISSNNFHIYWEEDGALVLITGDPSEIKTLKLRFTVIDNEIFSNFY